MIPFHKKTIFCTIRMIIPVDIHTHRRPQVPGTAIVNCFPESFVPQTEGWYSVGIHPWYIASFAASLNDSKARFEELLDHPQELAVGEAGLDKLSETPLDIQSDVFAKQAALAERSGKPLIIHCVKAWDELIMQRKSMKPRVPWIIHGFRGNGILAQQLLKQGFFLSFGEYFNQQALQAAWPDRLFAETDDAAIDIRSVYRKIASSLCISLEELTATLEKNVQNVFLLSVNSRNKGY